MLCRNWKEWTLCIHDVHLKVVSTWKKINWSEQISFLSPKWKWPWPWIVNPRVTVWAKEKLSCQMYYNNMHLYTCIYKDMSYFTNHTHYWSSSKTNIHVILKHIHYLKCHDRFWFRTPDWTTLLKHMNCYLLLLYPISPTHQRDWWLDWLARCPRIY